MRGRATANELARELEVSVRTVHRDIESLCQAGIPVVSDRGRHGGFTLVKGFRTQLTGLSEPEAQALPFLGLEAAAALGLEQSAEAAWLKLVAALPARSGDSARGIREKFHLDPVDWYQQIPTPGHLRAIATATWSCQKLRVDYESWRARSWRTVQPLGLVLKAGRWYLMAKLDDESRILILRVESIHGVEVLADQFRSPRGFILAQAWRAEVQRFEADLKRRKATIRCSAAALSRVDRLGGENAAAIRQSKPDRSGWRETEIWIEGLAHAASLLLGFGADVQVLAPEVLRQEMLKRVDEVRAIYGSAHDQRRRAARHLPRTGKAKAIT